MVPHPLPVRGRSPAPRIGVLRRSALLLASLLLASCGAGFAAVFDDDGSSGGEAPPPALVSRSGAIAPLLPPPNFLAELSLENAELPAAISRIAVELRAFDESVRDQQVIFRLPRENAVEFILDTRNTRAEVLRRRGNQGLEEADVPAALHLLVDGVDVAAPLSITLLRQPRASIEGLSERIEISPLGISEVTTRLTSAVLQLPDESIAPPGTARFTEEVLQRNNLKQRLAFGINFSGDTEATIVKVDLDPETEEVLVTARLPGLDVPVQAHYVIESDNSGRSTLISQLFYGPHIFGTSPTTGASEGGTNVVLSGQALVPDKLDTDEPDFSRLRIVVVKGGRESVLPAEQLRTELSNRNRLVFPMPPSPDGRAGPAGIRLEVLVDAVRHTRVLERVSFEATDVFVYGDASPYFGPRGAQLREAPVQVQVQPFLQTQVPLGDALVLTAGAEGMPFLGLYRTRGNGLFTRFGAPVRAGRSLDPLQRTPVDLCISEFFTPGVVGGVILNRGVGGFARHSFIVSDPSTNPPIRFNDQQDIAVVEAGLRCALGDLNEDGIADLLLLPEPVSGSAVPQLYLSAVGNQSFEFRPFSDYVGVFAFTTVRIDDVDRDGNLDLLFASGGLAPRLLLARGDGRGGYSSHDVSDLFLSLAGSGYTPDERADVVGLHTFHVGTQTYAVLVFAGLRNTASTPPAVVALRYDASRKEFDQPTGVDFMVYPSGDWEFRSSVQGQLDGEGADELVVAAEGAAPAALSLLQIENSATTRFVPRTVPTPVESVQKVRSVAIAPLVEGAPLGLARDLSGLVVAHETEVMGVTETRFSAFLAAPGSSELLRSPSAARQVDEDVLNLAVGRFRPLANSLAGAADVCLLLSGGLQLWRNDGLGDLSPLGQPEAVPGILPDSLRTVRARPNLQQPALETVAFITTDGRFGLMNSSGQGAVRWLEDSRGAVIDLREFVNPELRMRPIRAPAQIRCADVDGDSRPDLIVLLGLGEEPGQSFDGEAVLLLLRGTATSSSEEFPFLPPAPAGGRATRVHGNAFDLVIADFAPTISGPNPVEVALSIPRGSPVAPADGNHLLFYRLETSAGLLTGRFLRSARPGGVQALVAGREPGPVEVGDFNNDGRPDLAVVAMADRSLNVFYNFTTPSTETEVHIERFQPSPANPLALVPGLTEQAVSRDLNGDAVPDLVFCTVEAASPPRTHVSYLLSPGELGGPGLRVVPPQRSGDRLTRAQGRGARGAAGALGVGDLNRDGVPDLSLGWKRAGAGDYNLRVLFGNNF